MTNYFDEHEIDIVYKLAHDISGLSQDVNQKKDVILQNVYMRMFETKSKSRKQMPLVDSSVVPAAAWDPRMYLHESARARRQPRAPAYPQQQASIPYNVVNIRCPRCASVM